MYDKLINELEGAPVTYQSDYLTVREKEIEGRRYRLLERRVSSGRFATKTKLLEVFENNRWIRVWETGA